MSFTLNQAQRRHSHCFQYPTCFFFRQLQYISRMTDVNKVLFNHGVQYKKLIQPDLCTICIQPRDQFRERFMCSLIEYLQSD